MFDSKPQRLLANRANTINQMFGMTALALALGSALAGNAYAEDSSESSGTALQLSPLNITGKADELPTAHVDGYVALQNGSATKTNTPIIETPQSISVVTSDEMKDRLSDTLADALSYTPGITSQPSSFNRTSDRFRIRGFNVESATGGLLRDGMRLQNNSYDGVQEPYGLERVEVIRGAASVLYGQLSPGGMINGVSKRPTDTPLHELNLEVGNNDRKQLSADFGGALTDTLSYRLTLLNRDSETPVDYINDDKTYVAPALTWRPNEDTSLTILSFYQKSDTRFSAPLPYQMTKGVGNGPFFIGRHDFVGEPNYDDMSGEMSALGYEFEHRFDEHTKIINKLRYYDADVKWNYMQIQTSAAALAASANTGILRRQYSDRRERSRSWTTDTGIESKWNLGGAEHTFLVGFDGYDTSYDSHNFRANSTSLNLNTFNYGQPIVVNHNPLLDRGSQLDTLQKGIYLQDQIKFDDHWILLLGGRHDWADQSQQAFASGLRSGQKNEATTYRAGLVYKADNGLAPYVSYAESFFPVAVAEITTPGQTYAPTMGKQYEVGIRYQPEGRNLLLSAALYELTQTNALSVDLLGNARQIGEQRSRGLELEAKADLTPQLSAIASYAYTDARITKSVNPGEINQRIDDTPYNQAALWLNYDFALLNIPKLKVGAGARYQGTTRATGIPTDQPAYTLFDAMASYQIDKNWTVSVNANNVTNKQYVYCEAAICRYGDERELVTAVNFRW